jgi:PAS domain S-box-containing protein
MTNSDMAGHPAVLQALTPRVGAATRGPGADVGGKSRRRATEGAEGTMMGFVQDRPTRRGAADGDVLLRTMADGINDVVFVKDADGTYLFMNRAGAAALGRPLEEIIGRRDGEVLPADAVRPLRESSRAVLESGEAVKFEVAFTVRGERRTYLATNAPYRDAEGRLVGVLGIACDITERKRMEEELRASHAQLADVLESVTDGFYACDREWRITYINRRAEELLQLSRAKDIGRTIWETRPDARGTVFQRHFEQVMTNRVSRSFETQYRGQWWEVHAYPRVDGVSVYFRDITERKVWELALAESEDRYRLVAEATSDVIWDWDLRTGQVFLNEAIQQVFKYGAGEIEESVGWWRERIHAEDRGRTVASIQRAIGGAEVNWSAEYRFRRGDGSYADVLDRARIVRDSAGKAVRAIGAMQDLTQRKRAADMELERNSLRNAVRAMDRVLGVVGHELRTPLAGLRATTELLAELPKDAASFDGFLKSVHCEVVRMTQVVNDLVEVARLNSGTAKWNWGSYSPGQACEAAAESIQPLLQDGRVRLSVTASVGDMVATGDADAVRRLVLNLLSNAYKSTARGWIDVTAGRHTDADGSWVKISVSDTGDGMTPETVAKLGEAFALNAGVVGDPTRGSGLGLAICKGIVAAHGGRITVRSEVKAGTTVTAWLRSDLERPADAAVATYSITPVALLAAATE